MMHGLIRLTPIWLAFAAAYACHGADQPEPSGDAGKSGSSTKGGRGGASGTSGRGTAGKTTGGTAGKSTGGTAGKPASGGSGAHDATGGTKAEAGSGGASDGGAGAAGESSGGASHAEAGASGSGAESGGGGTPEPGSGAAAGVGQSGGAGEAGAGAPGIACPDGTDGDGDGYGVGCALGPDCNDFEPQIHPGASEICGNAFDDDCNPDTTDTCPVTCPEQGCGAGCSDGTREAFKDAAMYPNIAGCNGGFSVPGVLHATTTTCALQAGNDSSNPNGDGCSAADLCAPGWHVCRHPQEVAAHSPDGCVGSHDAENSFYITRQSGSGCGACAISTDASKICTNADCNTDCYPTELETNDVFGCGTVGSAPSTSCAPLDRFGHNACGSLPSPWDCSASSGYDEALVVHKSGPDAGGVLCCSE